MVELRELFQLLRPFTKKLSQWVGKKTCCGLLVTSQVEVRATTESNAPDSRLSDKVVTDGCLEDILTTHTLKYDLLSQRCSTCAVNIARRWRRFATTTASLSKALICQKRRQLGGNQRTKMKKSVD